MKAEAEAKAKFETAIKRRGTPFHSLKENCRMLLRRLQIWRVS